MPGGIGVGRELQSALPIQQLADNAAMINEEWLDCVWPQDLLDSAGDAVGPRKLRLVACAYARANWNLLNDESRNAIEAAEHFADGN